LVDQVNQEEAEAQRKNREARGRPTRHRWTGHMNLYCHQWICRWGMVSRNFSVGDV
jgi:hypothetical protein